MDNELLRSTVEAASRGDKSAFEALYNEYHDRLYFFVLKNVGNKENAEDITHDTFMRSMDRIGELNDPAAYVGWLHSIAYRKCLDCMAEQNRSEYFSDDDEKEAAIDNAETEQPIMLPEDYAANEEIKRTVRNAIDDLKADQRSAVILYYYNDLPVSEVAKTLGISENSARLKLFRARKTLKQKLERFAGSGMLCTVSVGSLVKSCMEAKPPVSVGTAVPAAVSLAAAGGAVVANAGIGKIVSIAAAGIIAVGVPIGIAMQKDGDGGLIGDAFTDNAYVQADNEQESFTMNVKLVKYYEDRHEMLVIGNDEELYFLEVPDDSQEELRAPFTSGREYHVRYSGNIALIYPAVIEGVEFVKERDGKQVRTFVEPYFNDLLERCSYPEIFDDMLEEHIADQILNYELENNVFPNFTNGEINGLAYLIMCELENGRATDIYDDGSANETVESRSDSSTSQIDFESEPLAETFAIQAENAANIFSELYGMRIETGSAEWDKPEDFDITDTYTRDIVYDIENIDSMTVYELLEYTLWYFQYNLGDEAAKQNAQQDIVLALSQDPDGKYIVTYCKFGEQKYYAGERNG